MTALHARTVFFVADVAAARRFYVEELGFALDWDSGDGVLQVSLLGFELILNEVGTRTRARAGHGRVFIGLEDDQAEPLKSHIVRHGIRTLRVTWGRPTLVVEDPDANQLFFWLPHDDFTNLGTSPVESTDLTDPA